MTAKFKVLSLGWGVQSFTLAAMVALGELEIIDYAVHADTTHESKLTYDFADRWRWYLHDKGVKVITVKPDNKNLGAFNQYRGVYIPAYTLSAKGDGGQLHRQCTGAWKIEPIRRWVQKHRNGEPVEMWLGISLDEFQRMRQSDVKYITNRYPLVELKMTRLDCMNWLDRKGIEIPNRSACVFCPYHSTNEWRNVKKVFGDWKSAVEHDNAIRKIMPPFDLYIHPSRKPLEEVDFRTAEEKGQLSLWDSECSGICGV